MAERLVPVISLKGKASCPIEEIILILLDFNNRKDEIREQLVHAAETAGFLTLVDHGISVEEIEAQFAISKSFFGLPKETKGRTPHSTETNNGWEYKVDPLFHPPFESSCWYLWSGTTQAKYWNVWSKGISLAATPFRMAKWWRCTRILDNNNALHGQMCFHFRSSP